jgi:nucleotide-binding universal stress UspA family protein
MNPTIARQPFAVANTPLLVGIDGTAASWDAVSWAEDELAAQPHAGHPRRMLLCRAYQPGTGVTRLPDPPDAPWLSRVDPGLARRLAQVRQRLATDDIGVTVGTGDLLDVLIDASAPGGMVVLAAPARNIAAVTRLAAEAAGVVIAVRSSTPAAAVTAGPFAGHVIVGIADGPSAQPAVRFAFSYADRHRLPIAAVHAATGDPGGIWLDDGGVDVHLLTHPFDLDLIEAAVADAQVAHPAVLVRRFAVPGHAQEALVRASAGAAMVVVGDRGRGSVARRILGSVSRDVIARSHCTVAVVHENGEPS